MKIKKRCLEKIYLVEQNNQRKELFGKMKNIIKAKLCSSIKSGGKIQDFSYIWTVFNQNFI